MANAPIDNEKENAYVDEPAPIGTIDDKPKLIGSDGQGNSYVDLAPAGEPLDARYVANEPAPIADPPESVEEEALDTLLAKLSPAARAAVLSDLGKADTGNDLESTNPALPAAKKPGK